MNNEHKSSLDQLRNSWDYIAYGVGAACAAAFDFHAGTHNYFSTMNEWGLGAIPLRRGVVPFAKKIWNPEATELRKDLERKCANAKELFSSGKSVPGQDLCQELDAIEAAWKKKLLKDAKLQEEIEVLVMRFLDRQKAQFLSKALSPPDIQISGDSISQDTVKQVANGHTVPPKPASSRPSPP